MKTHRYPTALKQLFIVVTIILGSCQEAPNQPGCTDPQALNYDPGANVNDGSCLYPPSQYMPQLIGELPSSLEECSGLAYFNDQLWTHPDGGNPEALYTLDTATASLLETYVLPNTVNTDWEDLAQNDTWLFVGDFGNNSGNRTDLRIYRIKKADLLTGTPIPESIQFTFSDQTDFTPAPNANNYDCEAFFYWQDSLHLFSKNWLDFKTRHYVLPATPGTHVAQLKDSLDVQGQITAADISSEGTVLLLGYNTDSSETFFWLLFDYHDQHFFSGNKRRVSMGSALLTSQVEGIAFRDLTTGYICSERYSFLPQKLLSFNVKSFLEPPVAAGALSEDFRLRLFPNPAGESLRIELPLHPSAEFVLAVFDLYGQYCLAEKTAAGRTCTMDISHLPAGAYWLQVRSATSSSGSLFIKR